MISPGEDKLWVGLYAAVGSLICTIAMAADVFQGFRRHTLWFPCRFFTINAASTSLIATSMKILMDLKTKLPGENDQMVKYISFIFLFTMLANFLPSLGGMDEKELLHNIEALGITIITIIVMLFMQIWDLVPMSIIIFFLLWPFCVALTVPASRGVLEHKYQKKHKSILDPQKIKFSSMELTDHVKKYWMMAETGNPQFVLASSPFCSASGLVCSLFATISVFLLIVMLLSTLHIGDGDKSDYGWSINVILIVQYFGIIVGSIAPIFRCITTATYFNPSLLWSIKRINMFRVEKHWTQRLQQWKHIHVTSYIPGRHCKKVFNHVKNMILDICMALQITLVVICKTICFVPSCIVLLFYSCCHFSNLLLKRFKKAFGASNSNVRSEIEEYIGYVLQIEDEAKLTRRTLRNMLRSITKLLHKSEKEQPRNLIKFLEKSKGFNVVDFHNDEALIKEETHNCWSLAAVTLTAIAIALPNIAKGDVKELLASMREGLKFVRHIEETLNAEGKSVKARKTARRIWIEAEVYCCWLELDLQEKSRDGKSSKEILEWFGKKAAEIVDPSNSKKRSVDDSLHKGIAASSMYRISGTVLRHCKEQENWPTDVDLFKWISTIIAYLLWACFTNLPRVIALKCHHDAIEKREESIRTAARLLGESKTILNILEEHQLPDLDQESMAYIDKWQALPKSQIPNGRASSAGIQSASSSSNESVILPIM